MTEPRAVPCDPSAGGIIRETGGNTTIKITDGCRGVLLPCEAPQYFGNSTYGQIKYWKCSVCGRVVQ